MKDVVLITPPPVEPVNQGAMLNQLGMSTPTDTGLAATLTAQLNGYIMAARADCENYCRRVFITQTWLLRRDSFPGRDFRYEALGYAHIELPKPPFQSVYFLQYVDVSGTLQTLSIDTTYGTNPADPQYGYQLDRGSETQPARLLPPFARPWPPTRMVPSNVLCQFRCGYGGPLAVSIDTGGVISGAKFNNDDQPLLPGDTGLAVSIPNGGGANVTLNTFIASVNGSGVATLATPPAAAIVNTSCWFGQPVPQPILQAIQFLAAWYYEQGSVVDVPMPRVVRALLDPYRDLT